MIASDAFDALFRLRDKCAPASRDRDAVQRLLNVVHTLPSKTDLLALCDALALCAGILADLKHRKGCEHIFRDFTENQKSHLFAAWIKNAVTQSPGTDAPSDDLSDL